MAEWQDITRGVVFPWTCDQYGHMNVRWYAHFFDDAGFNMWHMIGCAQSSMTDRGFGVVVAQIKIDYLHEMTAGTLFLIKGGFIRVGTKSATHFLRMYDPETGVLCATQESVEVFFDTASRKSRAMPDDFREKLTAGLVSLDED